MKLEKKQKPHMITFHQEKGFQKELDFKNLSNQINVNKKISSDHKVDQISDPTNVAQGNDLVKNPKVYPISNNQNQVYLIENTLDAVIAPSKPPLEEPVLDPPKENPIKENPSEKDSSDSSEEDSPVKRKKRSAKLKKPAVLLDVEAKADKIVEAEVLKEEKTEPPVQPQKEKLSSTNPMKKVFATGRRKASVAAIALRDGKGWIKINQKPASVYLQNNKFLLEKIYAPLTFLQLEKNFRISITVHGGGRMGQADAIKLGICRALCKYDEDFRSPLKLKGYLTRDARVKERKKYGLKKARKAPQYSKR